MSADESPTFPGSGSLFFAGRVLHEGAAGAGALGLPSDYRTSGCFETMRVRYGAVPLLPAHLSRLERGLRHLGLACPPEWADPAAASATLRHALDRLVPDAIRGHGESGPGDPAKHSGEMARDPDDPPALRVRATFFASVEAPGQAAWCVECAPLPPSHAPLRLLPVSHDVHGLPGAGAADEWDTPSTGNVSNAADAKSAERTAGPARAADVARMKLSSRNAYDRARQAARLAGCDDALLLDASGRVIETSIASIMWSRDGQVHMPPPVTGALQGVASEWLEMRLRENGVLVRRTGAEWNELLSADAVWTVNAVRGVQPVCDIAGTPVCPDSPELRLARSLFSSLWERHDHAARQVVQGAPSARALRHLAGEWERDGAVPFALLEFSGHPVPVAGGREADEPSGVADSAGIARPVERADSADSEMPARSTIATETHRLFGRFASWIEARDGRARLVLPGLTEFPAAGELLHWLRAAVEAAEPWTALSIYRRTMPGMLAGYLGYELKNSLEAGAGQRLQSGNPDPAGLPDLWCGQAGLVVGAEPDSEAGPADSHADPSADSSAVPPVGTLPPPTSAPSDLQPARVLGFAPDLAQTDYESMVRQAQKEIREGDYYEINIAHLFRGRLEGDPLDLYARMVPDPAAVPYASYIRMPGHAVCCASPERFLSRNGDRVVSSPIKGTRPRGSTAEQDQALRRELLDSQKERAENLMIVDLVRHDLNGVCERGSVRVDELFGVHTYGTVHQLVSTVSGRISPSTDPIEVLAACFPMGSMTGAPKISAMEAIERLERFRRGIYSGAIGWIAADGAFDFNVVIRTAVVRTDSDENVCYPAGGAITSDSDPASEWEETLIKTRVLRAVEAPEAAISPDGSASR